MYKICKPFNNNLIFLFANYTGKCSVEIMMKCTNNLMYKSCTVQTDNVFFIIKKKTTYY